MKGHEPQPDLQREAGKGENSSRDQNVEHSPYHKSSGHAVGKGSRAGAPHQARPTFVKRKSRRENNIAPGHRIFPCCAPATELLTSWQQSVNERVSFR